MAIERKHNYSAKIYVRKILEGEEVEEDRGYYLYRSIHGNDEKVVLAFLEAHDGGLYAIPSFVLKKQLYGPDYLRARAEKVYYDRMHKITKLNPLVSAMLGPYGHLVGKGPMGS